MPRHCLEALATLQEHSHSFPKVNKALQIRSLAFAALQGSNEVQHLQGFEKKVFVEQSSVAAIVQMVLAYKILAYHESIA